ncbi:hypothetical protein C8F04DRAFT_1188013 [Mycena alexandri]|uniref:CxC2-like cysteine cluster KDZ transposase-associated domain-containing protein n=1 Tax=Mycena alexandri TaxID=1745969 RepID=A0AAD6SLE4_9AGAR|nr:hypothetical protein C8F04DRAFT_1188013 [Mycena alexandri]
MSSVVERTSADGRRVYKEIIPVAPPSPVKRAHAEAARDDMLPTDVTGDPPLPTFDDLGFDLDSDRYHMDLGGIFDRPPSPVQNARTKTFKPSDKSLYGWRGLRDEYLRTLLRLEGCGDADEVWNGHWFSRTSLREIGLRIPLHHKGCASPAGVDRFVVLDLGYIHVVAVDFCGCEQRHSTKRRTELLRHRWYPATHEAPRTAATFCCLDFFIIQTHQAKTTMYDFYTSLERGTCGSGRRPPHRYPEFLRMVRQWRHLQMLKRAGRGHDPSGVNGTAPGALAMDCPACPRPGVNLPEGWENAPPEDKFLYFLFVALDACFRLKRRMVSSELRDPGLGTGWAYFVEQEPYRAYLLTRTNETEMSTCSGLAALDYANTKFSCGYSTTGVGMGVCARHEFVQPTGVGDLQKGERYSNMDWIYSAFMRWKDERLGKVVSYDIICQWFKKLFDRLLNMPSTVRFVVVTSLMRFVIPKMHIHSHTLACQVLFSLNFLLGAGQTDGEGIERPWANLGGVATSTREMGLGARCDTLDSHLGYWNWSKLIHIAELLRTRLDKAKVEEHEQTEAFEAFTQEQGERVEGWREMVHAFEADPTKKNPYEVKVRGMTEADVRLRLSEEEQEKGGPSLHDVSPSGFIYAGLDLEDQQRRVRVNIELKKAQTTAQKIDVVAMRRKLSRGIARFRKLQATYTPGALQALARRPMDPEETPEKTPLMLPSALAADEREAGCVGQVATYEAVARDAQCDAALLRLRHQLHIKSRFVVYKRNHSRHQGANIRSRTLVARNESKIRLHSEKYQAAWNAIRQLQGGDARKVGWRRLLQSDIRLMEDAEDLKKREERRKKEEARRRARTRQLIAEGEHVEEDDGDDAWEDDNGDGATTTESCRVVSWIWTVAGTTGSDAELEEGLRIEWAKAYARSRRWKEEIRLLQEEQRRVLESLEHEARKWEARAGRDVIKVGEIEEGFAQGAIAYALRQAAMYRDIAARAIITETEVRHGRGKRRTRAVVVEGAGQEADNAGGDGSEGDEEDEEDEGRGFYSDEEFVLAGEDEED